MAGRIRQSDVDEVKARTDIGDIIGERVALKNAGVGSMKGLCPFHDERSPSFNVRPQAGFYHCFGCGESGDVYSFLRKMDHLSFTETVERLAARIGYTLHYEDGGAAPEQSGRSRLFAANAAAAEFFRAQLSTPGADMARRFLGERGFDAGAAAHFGVGYAPQGWSGMHQALRSQGFSDEELSAAGLVSQGQRGVYDRFRGRVTWPIRDVTGQVIGFGARRLFDDDKGPKYLNTPETTIYHKAQVLYGLDLAKKDISRQHRVVVVEGYTDVMACHLAGITTAIATCGTAFGSDHISVLRRVMGDDSTAGEVVFTFDPDAAGQKAALRAFADAKRFNAQTYVATGPDGLDPCDLRLQRGDAAVRAVVETKMPMVEFVLDQRISGFDLASVEGRVGALRSAAPVVAELRDPLLQPEYVRVLARRLGMDTEDVRREVERAGRASTAPRESARTVAAPPADDGPAPEQPVVRVTMATLPRSSEVSLERDAMMAFLQYGHRMPTALLDRALALPCRHPALEAVRQALVAAPDMQRAGWAAEAVGTIREPYRSLGGELLVADFPALTDAAAVASASDLARKLLLRSLDSQKSELLGAIQRVAPSSEEGRAIRMQLREIDAERQRIAAEE
ncbi:DNA primase [Microbacterium sp. C7(2022)]|uniref:DNA primase n=1 Tax=Microbacterium sp. C7(2022) TaxID=2992759 RepID=UPI00237A5CAA|nr:DNA primase [Microbacterium sp. C7(2022)]MDE0547034.1 DNA primase [Microbacterium sp. C7(2022)]